MQDSTTFIKETRRKSIVYSALFALILVAGSYSQVFSQVTVDSTPSIRSFGLFYNSGPYTAAQATTMGYRYDMAVFGADAYTTTYYADMINAMRTNNPNSVILVYNSTDLGKINNSKSNAYEWDSLLSYANGAYPHRIFYHSLDSQRLGIGNNPDLFIPGLLNDPDSTKSEIGRFIGWDFRRHLNFADDSARAWQARFNKSLLSQVVGGSSRYSDGIWWDNCAVSQSLQAQNLAPTSVVVELSSRSWYYDQSWLPSVERPNDDTTGTRIRFEQGLLPMLKSSVDTFKNSPNWHPTGKQMYNATNWAEVRFDVQWSPFMWRPQMYDRAYTKYAYMEHTPNALKPAAFLGPGAANSVNSISTYFWSSKGPIAYFSHDTLATNNGVCVIYHPGFPYTSQYKPYGVSNRLYSDMALYYLIRTDSTYWKIHGYNAQANVGGGTGIAPGTSDSVMWVPAYSYDFSPVFPMDSVPYAYATSVPCTDCDARATQQNLGKDGFGQNWVVFRRNLPNGNMVLHRAVQPGGSVTGNSSVSPAIPLGGQYRKLNIDGSLGPVVTSTTLRNGEGAAFVFNGSINNTAPTTPSPTSPTGGATVSPSPTFVTGASTDPENSSLTYTFQVSKFQNFSSVAVSGAVTSSSTTQVSWQVSSPLQGQTSYWWRVKAADFIESSAWSAAQAFVTDVATNSPPSAPGISSPPNASNISQTSVTLVVTNSSDIDGNASTYDFELYNSAGTTLLDSQSVVVAGAGTTRWASSFTLVNGTTYSWRARAFDGAAFSPWSTSATFTVAVGSGNTPPSLPIPVSPANGDTLIGSSITFTWQNSFDPDADAVGYDVWLMSDSSGGSDIDSARNVPEAGTGSTTSRAFTTSLVNGRQYWWALRANDGQAWTSRSTPTSFLFADFTLGTGDGSASPSAPPNGTEVNSSRPTLVANNISASGPNTYYFELATDSSFVSIVALSPGLPEGGGGKTAWTIDTALQTGTVYFWRVKANADPFSVVSSFTVQPIPHASPVPFRPAEHSVITFHDLPAGASLVIMTLNGETVWRINNVVGGTALWDGSNSSGSQVSSGVYLWFIEGSSLKGKLVVQR